jgi:uncharacterized membrane protein
LHCGPWKTTSGPILMKEGKDTRLSNVVCSLYCDVLHLKLACMYGIFISYIFLESNDVIKESNKCYIFLI